MNRPARWIRLDANSVACVPAACRGFAHTQGERGAPVCFWGRAAGPVCLEDGLWAEPGEFVFAIVAARHLAPRESRWLAWGLSPLVAALRRFGAHAYLDGQDIRMYGTRIAGGRACEIDGCVAILGTFPADPPIEPPQSGERGRLLAIDPWLDALNREGRARQMLAAFRSALEVQHGWQFDTGWASEAEQTAVSAATAR